MKVAQCNDPYHGNSSLNSGRDLTSQPWWIGRVSLLSRLEIRSSLLSGLLMGPKVGALEDVCERKKGWVSPAIGEFSPTLPSESREVEQDHAQKTTHFLESQSTSEHGYKHLFLNRDRVKSRPPCSIVLEVESRSEDHIKTVSKQIKTVSKYIKLYQNTSKYITQVDSRSKH